MVTRRVSEDLLAATKSSLTRRVTSSLLRVAVKVSGEALAAGFDATNRRLAPCRSREIITNG